MKKRLVLITLLFTVISILNGLVWMNPAGVLFPTGFTMLSGAVLLYLVEDLL